MTTDEKIRRHINELEGDLGADDSRGTRRAEIARLYMQLREPLSAARWFLEAARHAEWSEMALVPLTWAKKAVEVAPESLDARREYKRQWQRSGMPGEPPPSE